MSGIDGMEARMLVGVDIPVLARYMREKGEGIEEIIYMLEKPWKWEREAKHLRECPTWKEDNTCEHKIGDA